MLAPLPQDIHTFMHWSWPQMEPYYTELATRALSAETVAQWLADWTALDERVAEMYTRLYVATTVNTADEAAKTRFEKYLDEIYPTAEAARQKLKEHLLASGLQPDGFEIQLRNLRAAAELFREANLPLLAEELKLVTQHEALIGSQSVQWAGEEKTLPQLAPLYQRAERANREQVWRLMQSRQLADREPLNQLWQTFLRLRLNLAANAARPDYRAYKWQQLLRFDYTPGDCEQFHIAIEAAVVPAVQRLYARRRRRLGVEVLRPWDLVDGWYQPPLDPPGQPPLKPFTQIEELNARTSAIFQRVDPVLGGYFETMRREALLDLDNRKHKAPGGYCIDYGYSRRPFILMNAVGLHDDVQTLLHEGGHAFHVFEVSRLPYHQQKEVGMEIAEVASMAMELLAAPYLTTQLGGFYSEPDAARARIEHLETMLTFWPFMACVDAFQHWVYTHPNAALDPAQCDAQWSVVWDRFNFGVDWSGLEAEKATGWQRKIHIFQVPFYYVEYGLAQLGAVQVWANALRDQAGAVAAYRRALALGATRALPELFAAAGATFAFDADTLQRAVDVIETTIEALEKNVNLEP
jgi:oligoendopeptidase F